MTLQVGGEAWWPVWASSCHRLFLTDLRIIGNRATDDCETLKLIEKTENW